MNGAPMGRSLERLVSRHWVKAPDGELLLHLRCGRLLSVREIETSDGVPRFEALKIFRYEVIHYAGLHGSQIEAQHAAEMTANDRLTDEPANNQNTPKGGA